MNAFQDGLQPGKGGGQYGKIRRMNTDAKANQESLLAKMDNDKAEMRSTVDDWMTDIKDARKETTTRHDVTEADSTKTEHDPKMMKSVEEHQEVPK
jgi:hypothetical protein